MPYKIEKKAVHNGRAEGEFADFVRALRELKVGESFLCNAKTASNRRMAISIVQILLDRKFGSKSEGAGLRIGRLL